MLLADGFEKAFIGITIPCPNAEEVAVYDSTICLDVLMKRDGMTEEEAIEYFHFNVVGAFVGAFTPIFITRATIEEAKESCDYYG